MSKQASKTGWEFAVALSVDRPNINRVLTVICVSEADVRAKYHNQVRLSSGREVDRWTERRLVGQFSRTETRELCTLHDGDTPTPYPALL